MNNMITAVVLAAGKGTRMKSSRAKVLHEVFFKPMLHHVLDAVAESSIEATAVVVGHQSGAVTASLRAYPVTTVRQEEQLGTGHAVLCAEQACAGAGTIMILCGDTPLIRPETLDAMIRQHRSTDAGVTLMTTVLTDPSGYGRIINSEQGEVLAIVEQKDASAEQLRLKEINAGIYLVERAFLFSALKEVGTDNSQGEVYLTDIVAIANRQGRKVHKYNHPEAIDVLGVNSRFEMAQAHQELQRRRNRELMLAGVTMYGPETIFVAQDIPVGRDTVIHPGVQITGRSTIGSGCLLEPGVLLHDCQIGDNAVVGAYAVLRQRCVEPAGHVAPQTGQVQ
ncbi:MAG: bifunctional N-acetylglucosamine-1-phosphate uridyltransferase/glucosamine-1-phosphate acetyltransferase [Deltaproteobacteria bacterium]|nr:bifunctional N-acetylglucosamine-1-phosphate uridyltransferase/glucosamine-1-phosphate acetyltransferase [Deltaproteobacteria bacterium]